MNAVKVVAVLAIGIAVGLGLGQIAPGILSLKGGLEWNTICVYFDNGFTAKVYVADTENKRREGYRFKHSIDFKDVGAVGMIFVGVEGEIVTFTMKDVGFRLILIELVPVVGNAYIVSRVIEMEPGQDYTFKRLKNSIFLELDPRYRSNIGKVAVVDICGRESAMKLTAIKTESITVTKTVTETLVKNINIYTYSQDSDIAINYTIVREGPLNSIKKVIIYITNKGDKTKYNLLLFTAFYDRLLGLVKTDVRQIDILEPNLTFRYDISGQGLPAADKVYLMVLTPKT